MVALAAAAQRGVAELAIEARPGEHEGVLDGEALRDVDGHRVAVLQRRVAVDGAVLEVARAERDLLAAEVERELPSLGVDGGDVAAVAVDDAEAEVVAFDEHVVADRELAAGQAELLVHRAGRRRACARGRAR